MSIYLSIYQTTCIIYLFIYLSNNIIYIDNLFPFTYEKIYFLSCSPVRSYIYLIYLFNQLIYISIFLFCFFFHLPMYLCIMYIINYNLGKRQTIQQSLNLRICLFCTFSFEMYMLTKKYFRKKG